MAAAGCVAVSVAPDPWSAAGWSMTGRTHLQRPHWRTPRIAHLPAHPHTDDTARSSAVEEQGTSGRPSRRAAAGTAVTASSESTDGSARGGANSAQTTSGYLTLNARRERVRGGWTMRQNNGQRRRSELGAGKAVFAPSRPPETHTHEATERAEASDNNAVQ